MRIEDVMTTEVATVGPATPLKDVARLLERRGISGVPVVDDEGAVLGVVSEADVVIKERGPAESARPFWRFRDPSEAAQLAKSAAVTAADAMTSPAIVLGPERPVSAAARIMVDCGVNRLPVVKDGRLIGILTRADLVRAFTRSDDALEREIRTEVLERAMWIPSGTVAVSVTEGAVRLSGIVETETDADVIVRLVARVPGVVSVTPELGWRLPQEHEALVR
jgi:CBS domain-containing protein